MITARDLRRALADVDNETEVRIVVHTPDGSTNIEVSEAKGGFTTNFLVVADVRRPGLRSQPGFRWGQPVAGSPPVVGQSAQGAATPPVQITGRAGEPKR